MKKTVLILAVTLGSLCTFAQGTWQKPIPTKEPGKVLFQNDFSNPESVIIGHNLPAHTISKNAKEAAPPDTTCGDWVWMPNKDSANFKPANPSEDAGRECAIPYLANFKSKTADDGYVLIAPVNNAASCFNVKGGYDAYVQINKEGFSTATSNSVQVEFYQDIYRANKDKYYVEWSSDSVIWENVEINMNTIDIDPGNGVIGTKKVTLLSSAANKAKLWIRFRFTGMSGSTADPDFAGLVWFIDDVKVMEGPASGLEGQFNYYYEHAYHFLPKGIKIPAVRWYAYGWSTGSNNATNVRGVVEAIGKDNSTSVPYPSMSVGKRDSFSINWTEKAAKSMSFPTSTAGTYKVTSRIESENAGIVAFDTMTVQVREQTEITGANAVRWARDNGNLRDKSRWTYGWQAAGKSASDPALVTQQGYTLCVVYQLDSILSEAGDSVFINGIQYVSSNMSSAGSAIAPVFYEGGSNITGLLFGEKGIPRYTLESKDIPVLPADAYTSNPPVINIRTKGYYMKPNTRYLGCYQIATASSQFYVGMDRKLIVNNVAIPVFGGGSRGIWVSQPSPVSFSEYSIVTDNTPMIRLLVGNKADTLPSAIDQMSAASFKLSNYPNPAVGTTKISYELAASANVSLEVRDIAGRIVKTVNIGKKGMGADTYDLDLSNLSAGSYFYTLKANGLSETKKLVIVK